MTVYQDALTLFVYNLGMSLTRMGQRSDVVRLLDDIDVNLNMSGQTTDSHQLTSIQVNCKPIILRASYRDILLLLGITNKVLEAYGQQNQQSDNQAGASTASLHNHAPTSQRPGLIARVSSRGTQTSVKPIGKAKVLMSKEELQATVDGLKLILIGDIQEQPLCLVHLKAFRAEAKDWTGQVKTTVFLSACSAEYFAIQLDASTTMTMSINYWNLTNSHWEPRKSLVYIIHI